MKNSKQRQEKDIIDISQAPPQALELEAAVLGALMVEPDSFEKASKILKPEMFYLDSHCEVYNAICSLHAKNKPGDILTVVHELTSKNILEVVGGAYFVNGLTNNIVSGANIEYHSRIVYEMYLKRKVINISRSTIRSAHNANTDAFDVLDKIQNDLNTIPAAINADSDTTHTLSFKFADHIDKVIKGENSGILTGVKEFDDHVGGLHKTDLIVIGSYSSNGKTATAINILDNTANAEVPHYGKLYTLEQSNIQIYMRQVSMTTGINSKRILKDPLDEKEIESCFIASESMRQHDTIYEENLVDYYQIVADMRKEAKLGKVHYFIIDYLQLIKGGDGADKRERIGNIANDLKRVAKQLNMPIILISQLRRPSNPRAEPAIYMLKESGEIENAADIIWLPWIPFNPPAENYDSYNYKGMEYPTITGKNKLMIHSIDKGRSYGLTSWASTIDETLKIRDYVETF